MSIFNRVLLSESERIAVLLRKRKYHLATTSAWLQKLVIQGISGFHPAERGGEGVMRKLLSSLASTRSDTEGPEKPVQSSSRPF